MDKEVKKLRDAFVARGGKEEDFWAKRKEIAEKREKVNEQAQELAEKFDRAEINHKMSQGYTEAEAKAEQRTEELEAKEAKGFGTNRAIRGRYR